MLDTKACKSLLHWDQCTCQTFLHPCHPVLAALDYEYSRNLRVFYRPSCKACPGRLTIQSDLPAAKIERCPAVLCL